MTMDVIAVGMVAIIVAIICAMLKTVKPEFALATSLCASAILLIYILTRFSPVSSMISALMLKTNVPVPFLRAIFNALGICIITAFAVDSCKDAGESALAAKVELAGKIAVIIICIPMITEIIKLIETLLS